jgi:hypothetical protein
MGLDSARPSDSTRSGPSPRRAIPPFADSPFGRRQRAGTRLWPGPTGPTRASASKTSASASASPARSSEMSTPPESCAASPAISLEGLRIRPSPPGPVRDCPGGTHDAVGSDASGAPQALHRGVRPGGPKMPWGLLACARNARARWRYRSGLAPPRRSSEISATGWLRTRARLFGGLPGGHNVLAALPNSNARPPRNPPHLSPEGRRHGTRHEVTVLRPPGDDGVLQQDYPGAPAFSLLRHVPLVSEGSADGPLLEPSVAEFGVRVSVVIPTLNEEKNRGRWRPRSRDASLSSWYRPRR